MTLHTPLCDLLGVEHPILLAGMGGVSYAHLAAAVSNAGGYGVLGMAGTSPDFIRLQMAQVRDLTDKPFGVDLLAATPDALTVLGRRDHRGRGLVLRGRPGRAPADHRTAEGGGAEGHGGLRGGQARHARPSRPAATR